MSEIKEPHWLAKAVADVYNKYEITDEEDILVSTWSEDEEDAKQEILKSCTPERADELIRASTELKDHINKFIEDMKKQIASLSPEDAKPTAFLESLTAPALSYIFPNDKTTQRLSDLTIDGTQYPLSEEKKGSSKQVTSYISFDFDEAAKETDLAEFTLTFSEFDKQIQEAVVSLMKAGNRIITPFMIYKTLTGNTSKQISEKWENDIKKSMRKFNSVFVTADLTETVKLYPALANVAKHVKGTRLMKFDMDYIETKNGSKTLSYHMDALPILYAIADAKKQVGMLDIKLLANSKTTNTIDNTELKIYLLKRINGMKHGQTNSILFETIYKTMDRTTAQNRRTTRANAEKLLLQFKADKIIKDFEIENKGRQPAKIKIIL